MVGFIVLEKLTYILAEPASVAKRNYTKTVVCLETIKFSFLLLMIAMAVFILKSGVQFHFGALIEQKLLIWKEVGLFKLITLLSIIYILLIFVIIGTEIASLSIQNGDPEFELPYIVGGLESSGRNWDIALMRAMSTIKFTAWSFIIILTSLVINTFIS